ncbi:MAG TPA: family 43 glycosylhydrolase [Thermoleophilaceae bacterium]|nr:family 43 glycosylhydrolase [Thermoleophilaceae bacterium]
MLRRAFLLSALALVVAPAADAAPARVLKLQAERLHRAGQSEREPGGRLVLLSGRRAALRATPQVPAVERISLRARARRCGGWPVVSVSLGGRELARLKVRSARMHRYAKQVRVGAGRRPLELALVNPHRGKRCAREVAIDVLELTRRKDEEFANPAFGAFADPMVLDLDDQHTDYYAYATGGYLPMARSDDLVHWRYTGTALQSRPAWVPQTGDWNPWAPSVISRPARCPGARRGPCYVMFYSALNASLRPAANCVAVALSSSPGGPFVDRGPLQAAGGGTDQSGRPPGCGDDGGYSNIDADPFVDRDGRAYLYFSTGHACPPGTAPRSECPRNSALSVVPLTSNWLRAAGPRHVVLRNADPWQQGVVEGPWMRRLGRRYQLFYSGGLFTRGYGMGLATGRSPMGAFRNWPLNPLLHDSLGVKSAGGGSLVTGPSGQTWVAYHGRPGSYGADRLLRLDRLGSSSNGSVAIHGPTMSDQPAP